MMRYAKLILLAGLILAATSTAGALTTTTPGYIPMTHGWNGPIYSHLHDYSMGDVYLPGPATPMDTWLTPAQAIASGATPLPALGAVGGESGWGVFKLDAIYEGKIMPSGDIMPQNIANPLFYDGYKGKELVGIYGGRGDYALKFGADGSQSFLSIGDQYEMYVQDHGLFDEGAAGSTGRNADGSYTTVGDDASSVVPLNGVSQAGFFPDVAGFGTCPETIAQIFPGGAFPGHSDLYISLYDNAGQVPAAHTPPIGGSGVLGGLSDPSGWTWNLNYFQGNVCGTPPDPPGYFTADLRLHVTTTTNNGYNDPNFFGNPFNWTVQSSDPLTGSQFVPEPVTMLSALLAVSGLAGYVRRRRMG